MTEKLYDKDSHLKEFTAEVLSCERDGGRYIVTLDRTAFFPEGGGQYADRGTLDGACVLDVQLRPDGVIVHTVDRPFSAGQQVTGLLDWDCRFRRMQNHSGEHIISGIVYRRYGYDNVGFHLSDTEMTIDFNGLLTRKQLIDIEFEANSAIVSNAKFSAYYPSAAELKDLKYRSKLELDKNVRIVTVEGYDSCACCAPHVSSAAEIGIIKILDCFKHKGGVRLFVRCGFDALEDYERRYQSTLRVSGMLSVKQHEIAEAVDRLDRQISLQKQTISRLKKELIKEKIKTFTSNGEKTALFEEGLDIKELQLFADGLYKQYGGIRGVFSGCGEGYSFAICGEENALAMLFDRLKQSFQVRGGGRGSMVQGTVYADMEQILSLFK